MNSAQTTLGITKTAPLNSFLHPRSIAVVGASDVPGKVGHTVMQNLLAGSFHGEVYPVNVARERVIGRKGLRQRLLHTRRTSAGHHCHARLDGPYSGRRMHRQTDTSSSNHLGRLQRNRTKRSEA
jgi:hypothetical protein